MIEIIGLSGLAICIACFTHIGESRWYVAQVAFLVYLANVLIGMSPFGQSMEYANFFAFQSLYNLTTVLLLSLIITKRRIFSTTVILFMLINISSIGVNAFGYWMWINSAGLEVYVYLINALYVLQLVLLMSKRLTDGIFGGLSKLAVFCRAAGIIDTYCIKNGQRK